MHAVFARLQPVKAPTGDKADAVNAACESARQMAAVILKRCAPSPVRTLALQHVVDAYRDAAAAINRY